MDWMISVFFGCNRRNWLRQRPPMDWTVPATYVAAMPLVGPEAKAQDQGCVGLQEVTGCLPLASPLKGSSIPGRWEFRRGSYWPGCLCVFLNLRNPTWSFKKLVIYLVVTSCYSANHVCSILIWLFLIQVFINETKIMHNVVHYFFGYH